LFIITDSSKLRKYKLKDVGGELYLLREYANMHSGKLKQIIPSVNCSYLFSVGEDNLLKVWDYHFRGGLTPVF